MSHDVGGYLGRRLAERCCRELLVRWAQFGALSPLMQAHGRFQQEAWTYDGEVLGTLPGGLVLHERLVPYIRAAAATAGAAACRSCARSASSIPRPRLGDRRLLFPRAGPVGGAGAGGGRGAAADLPRGEWLDWWTGGPGSRVAAWIEADRPAGAESRCGSARGSVVVTYPEAERVARGLEAMRGNNRPLEATLWGEPPCGRAKAVLADGSEIHWRAGKWEWPRARKVEFLVR